MSRFLAILPLLAGLLVVPRPALAQQQQQPSFDELINRYRRFAKKPTNAIEFWGAIQFELEVGRPDLAAQHLKNMLAAPPRKEDLLALHQRYGLAPFIRLKLVDWDRNPDKRKAILADVDTLVKAITKAVEEQYGNRARIQELIRGLTRSDEEYRFSIQELIRSGALAIPPLLEELKTLKGQERMAVLNAMSLFDETTVPPLLAALDSDDSGLRGDLVDVLRRRRDFTVLKRSIIDPAPFLWPLASTLEKSGIVRGRAQAALARLLDLKATADLPTPRDALLAEVDLVYYGRDFKSKSTNLLPVWIYDTTKKNVERRTMTPAERARFYALRYARQALDIEPAYRPAQTAYLSLLLDTGYKPGDVKNPLGTLDPALEQLLARSDGELLIATLERALRDERPQVALPLVKTLGALADTRAGRPTTSGQSPLIKALFSGDRRVEFAAAEALLNIPGEAAGPVKAQIVKVLTRALEGEPKTSGRPRILVALTSDYRRREARKTLEGMNLEALVVGTARDAMRRLNQASDVDAILVDSTIADPGLSWLLANLRSDAHARRLPVLLAALPESREARELIELLRKHEIQLSTLRTSERTERRRVAATRTTAREEDLLGYLDTLLNLRMQAIELETDMATLARRKAGLEVGFDSDLQNRLTTLFRVFSSMVTEESSFAQRKEIRDLRAALEATRTFKEQLALGERFVAVAREKRGKLRDFLKDRFLVSEKDITVLEELQDRIRAQERTFQNVAERYEREVESRSEAMRKLASRYKNVEVTRPGTFFDPLELRERLVFWLEESRSPALSKEERQAFAAASLRLLSKMARGELKGYDARPAVDAVVKALRDPALPDEAKLDGIRVVGALSGSTSQRELAAIVLDESQKLPARLLAAEELQKHLQAYGKPAGQEEANLRLSLQGVFARPNLDGKLKAKVALLLGALNPDPRTSGQQLRDFKP